MSCQRRGILLLLLIPFTPAWGAAPKKEVAALTNVAGGVETKARGTPAWSPVKSARPLYEGDAVRIGKGGRVLLLQVGCPPRALKEGETVVVSASKKWLTGVSNQPLTPAQYSSVLRLLQVGARSSLSQPTAVRGGAGEGEIALSPRSENVLDGRPVFRWQERAPGSSYELELYRGETVVWSVKTPETHVAYPAGAPPLKPGVYRWQLYVKVPAGQPDMDGAEFSVPENATARRIQAEIAAAQSLVPEAYGANLPLVGVYLKHKLYTPAETVLQRALNVAPEDATLRRTLAQVYGLMGRTQAEAEIREKTR
jgi:hypothetical protein